LRRARSVLDHRNRAAGNTGLGRYGTLRHSTRSAEIAKGSRINL
jgi:hypothetical protein